jgi:hypothetical protein
MSIWKPSALFSLASACGMYGQIQFKVTPGVSATRAAPPGTAAAVEETDAEGDGLLPAELPHAAIPTASSAAAPATAMRASGVRRLFRNMKWAPWLCSCAFPASPGAARPKGRFCQDVS